MNHVKLQSWASYYCVRSRLCDGKSFEAAFVNPHVSEAGMRLEPCIVGIKGDRPTSANVVSQRIWWDD